MNTIDSTGFAWICVLLILNGAGTWLEPCLALNGALCKYLCTTQTTIVVELGITEASEPGSYFTESTGFHLPFTTGPVIASLDVCTPESSQLTP